MKEPQHGTAMHTLWPERKPLLGMVHLQPLPGAPRWGGDLAAVVDAALADATALVEAGFDGLIVENFLDVPFHADTVPPETVAAMTRVTDAVVRAAPLPVGVNVLRNDAHAALAVAVSTGARFIRVNVHTGVMYTDQGEIRGRAADTLRLRSTLAADVAILADVMVKHATAPPGLTVEQAAEDAFLRGLADVLVISGSGTGKAADPARLRAVKEAVPHAPVLVGSGVREHTVGEWLAVADGAIVGSALARGGIPGDGVDPRRARAFLAAAGR